MNRSVKKESESIDKSIRRAADFLLRASGQTNHQGLPHAYRFLYPMQPWSVAYPEVTGYTVPTFFQLKNYFSDDTFADCALSHTDWLCQIQHPEGWFYSGIRPDGPPSLFNTAMIVMGLTASFKYTNSPMYREAAIKAANWIIAHQDNNGGFSKFAYSKGFQPAYYTRVGWAIQFAHRTFQVNDAWERSAEALMKNLSSDFENRHIKNVGFHPLQPAFLHTIAYAIRGALEWEDLTVQSDFFNLSILEKLTEEFKISRKWPGRIWPNNKPDYSFRCLTGEAQILIALMKSRKVYLSQEEMKVAINSLIDSQSTKRKTKGALSGSKPIYGPYMRFKYPAWATKFLIDALLMYQEKISATE